ncbi:dihydrofolate reductase [Hugenholtzia roseola]|uniref:dihydrofolate reductase n=1 Tax=Hugenholtzia roseola TaxID=1002 RepID=UPI00047E9F99|nr:dihydrofolate reductase [Hugenholtzia roseola]
MQVSLIVAKGERGEIGVANEMLWKLPADMKFFRQTTTGHTLLVGRKTFESFGKGLKNRFCIVLTSQTDYEHDPTLAALCPDLDTAYQMAQARGEKECFVVGGAQIYEQVLQKKWLTKLYITEVLATFERADAFFPSIEEAAWQLESETYYAADAQNQYNLVFKRYTKRT